MADLDKFIAAMLEFKGTMQASLNEISREIKEMKAERKEHQSEFWDKMEEFSKSLHTIDTEVKLIKGKAGLLATLIAFIVATSISVVGWFIKK